MSQFNVGNYARVFSHRSFRYFWIGYSLSDLGDTISKVALTWLVYQMAGTPQALGLLSLFYTGPVILGGLMAGWLLDRFSRQRVMMVDSLLRAGFFALIPILQATGQLALWHIYAIAAVYGFLMMIPLAGGPTIVPTLVPPEHLSTANALEMLSFTLSGVIGPPLAGILIANINAPNVVVLDVISYLIFAAALTRVHPTPAPGAQVTQRSSYRLGDAFRLMLTNRILLSTTFMFMAYNIGGGAFNVMLPLIAAQTLGGGPELYGVLLGFRAVGEVASSLAAGSLVLPLTLGVLICLSQLLAGASLTVFLLPGSIVAALLGVTLFGVFSAPLTIWAQTLRMKIIPPALRGRTFALLRMLMQSGNPIGGAIGGAILPFIGIPMTIALAALFAGAPGLIGLRVNALRNAGGAEHAELTAAQGPSA